MYKLWLLPFPILHGKMKSKEMDDRDFFRQSLIKERNAKCSKFSADEDEISACVKMLLKVVLRNCLLYLLLLKSLFNKRDIFSLICKVSVKKNS